MGCEVGRSSDVVGEGAIYRFEGCESRDRFR